MTHRSFTSSIPDEGVNTRQLPKDTNMPIIRLNDIKMIAAFSEVEKMMHTYTSVHEHDSMIDDHELKELHH